MIITYAKHTKRQNNNIGLLAGSFIAIIILTILGIPFIDAREIQVLNIISLVFFLFAALACINLLYNEFTFRRVATRIDTADRESDRIIDIGKHMTLRFARYLVAQPVMFMFCMLIFNEYFSLPDIASQTMTAGTLALFISAAYFLPVLLFTASYQNEIYYDRLETTEDRQEWFNHMEASKENELKPEI